MQSGLRVPLKAVAWYLLSIVVFVGSLLIANLSGAMESNNGWVIVTLGISLAAVLFWGLPFLILASLYSARSVFNTAHVHPMLPPVVTGILVWVLAVFNLVDSGMPQGPPVVQFSSLLGGPLSVTMVSLWEMWRLRTIFGVTVRG